MMPSLTRLDSAGSAGAELSTVPPPRFRPLRGPTRDVRLNRVEYSTAQGVTFAQKNGLRYERKVQEFLSKKFPDYIPGPYIHFTDDSMCRTVQPDGILVFDDVVFIFEIKFQHVPEAWWQLEKLYKPLLKLIYPTREVSCVEICRSFDPAMPFPTSVEGVIDLLEWTSKPRSDFGVYLWRK